MSDQIDLEMKLGFLEHTVEELHQALLEESRARQVLEQRLDRLASQLSSGGNEVGPQHDPPPHY